MKYIATFLLAAALSGCSLTNPPVDPNAPPPPPPTAEEIQERNEKRCMRATFLVAGGKSTARLVMAERDTAPAKRERVEIGIKAVDSAVEAYCAQVMSGSDVDLEYIAMKAVLDTLDDLNRLSLEPDDPVEEPVVVPIDPVTGLPGGSANWRLSSVCAVNHEGQPCPGYP